MIRRCQPLLGTYVTLTLDGGSDSALQSAANQAFDLIRQIQRIMSFHDPESDVSRLNRYALNTRLKVHPWTWKVLNHALKLSADTEGAFDITVAPKLVEWGYLPRHQNFSPQPQSNAWQHIQLLPDDHVRFHQPLQIDLGGIAKGFAVDQAICHLATKCDIPQATVNAGGDLRFHGDASQMLVIRDPKAPTDRLHQVAMLRPAVATSAAYFSRRKVGSSSVTPIIHPHTGRALVSQQSVSVFSPTCMEADALTKAVLLAPQSIWSSVLSVRNSLALFVSGGGDQTLFPA